MDVNWLEDLKINLPKFLNSLNKKDFEFLPVLQGYTKAGEELSLGFSCYALKIFYMTNLWDELNEEEKSNWCNYINSFQTTSNNFPNNSFIDNKFLEHFLSFSIKNRIKNFSKLILNLFFNKKYLLFNQVLIDSIRAETKQAISTLNQVGKSNNYFYSEFPKTKEMIEKYLNSLDWSKPWNAGAQFAAICVFVQTQIESEDLKNELIISLGGFVKSLSHADSGLFYLGKKPSNVELVNGAMKVITGLDWIGINPMYPKELINTFLSIDPSEDGCDLVDTVYVLYMCSNLTDYKSLEVEQYLQKILELIKIHYFPEHGGFTYFQRNAQTHYYGVKISSGINSPDLHGTLLLTWAISMISQIIALPTSSWKVLKP